MKRIGIPALALLLVLCLTPAALAQDAVSTLLESRASHSFLDEPVAQEHLDAIIRCGLQAPSAGNRQPWHFTVVRNRDAADRVIGTSGVVIVVSGYAGGDPITAFDCGLATQAMYTAAQSLGLGANIYVMPVANVNETMREALAIPDGYEALMVLTVGVVATDAASSASPRNPADEMVTYID